ncbi:MAG TPA: lysoplasmalogenase [Cyclobacteriaceae bacterium]|nr:lysoplasmalogenase [Cyclobacteriaceae bacterium]
MIRRFSLPAFAVVSIIEILSRFFNWQTSHVVCKPLLIPLLTLYYCQSVSSIQRTFAAALVFCWLGDVFLLGDQTNELFFLAGLGSFLIAHLLLIFCFRRFRLAGEERQSTQRVRLSFPVVMAGSGLVTVLYPKLGDLKIPVMVYAMTLALMVLQSIFRLGRTGAKSFRLVFIGATSFMLSDSLLAINKFYRPLPYAGVWIMITYLAAMYLIVQGVISHQQHEQV